ncbi:hypothetical protein L5515_017234 [Caenorhabditis briggsae]|uniref:Uncharacterized protein n=1 Tax=Caenorhabditis briggsae TaxID=6238 RepID=A0AAE9FCS0_CAEBR|nr:hypothetical protein L5515_017234 [Caenorhabditis briggsae]
MNLTLDHDNKNLKTQSACNQSNNPIEHHCYMSKDITENSEIYHSKIITSTKLGSCQPVDQYSGKTLDLSVVPTEKKTTEDCVSK